MLIVEARRCSQADRADQASIRGRPAPPSASREALPRQASRDARQRAANASRSVRVCLFRPHELGHETLKKIAVELTVSLRRSVTVDWARRETVRARLRVMVKTLLRRYKYPPDRQEEATETVLKQAQTLSAEWVERWR